MPDATTAPRDFVKEVPELERLAREPAIARALQKSDALALYDALRAWRAAHTDVQEAWVDRLLAQRRFFRAPIKRAPSLMTMNGIGMRLHGRDDAHEDGTYIATHSVVVLFIPVAPLGQYLVVDAEGGGWHFLGRVPMGRGTRVWSRVAAAAVLVMVLAGAVGIALGAWQSSQATSVQVLNGLDFPVRVKVAKREVTLPPGSHQALALAPGPHTFVAERTDGTRVDEASLEVPRWTDLVVYNVLGAAPAYLDEVVYQSQKSKDADGAKSGSSTALAGRRTYVHDNVSYIFREPPDSVQRSSRQGPVTYLAFGVAAQGWRSALRMLEHQGDTRAAAELATAIVRAEPDEPEARQRAFELTNRAGGVEAVLALAKSWVEHEPENGGAQRLYVDALRGLGRGAEAVAFAEERLRALPDSAEFAELMGRAEEPDRALARFRTLAETHPHVARFHRQYGERLLGAGRFPEALAAFERIAEGDTEQRARALSSHALALVLLGKEKDAAALLEAHADPDALRWDDVVLYGQLAKRGAIAGSADRLFAQYVGDDPNGQGVLAATFALEHGAADAAERVRALPDGAHKDALRLRLAAQEDPEKAVELAIHTPDRALAELDDPTALLLALEARRVGQPELAVRLERAVAEIRLDRAAAWRYVESGADADRLAEWSLDFQAVLHLERARKLERSDRAQAELLYARAGAESPLGGPVPATLERRAGNTAGLPTPTHARQEP